jgi:hypothetical protein
MDMATGEIRRRNIGYRRYSCYRRELSARAAFFCGWWEIWWDTGSVN